MAEHKNQNLILEDLGPENLIFRNFAGIERGLNSEGDRNFSIKLDPKKAKSMIADGWRVKQLKPRGEEEEGDYILKVKLNYKRGKPPRVVVITSKSPTGKDWGQKEVKWLDMADIQKADVIVNGWWNEGGGTEGYSGYLKSMFVTLEEDYLELKYSAELKDFDAEDEAQESEEESDANV